MDDKMTSPNISVPTIHCRVCGSLLPPPTIDLGTQALSGTFPDSLERAVPQAPLRLTNCNQCGLVQLADTILPDLMYNKSYGYRSGINESMRQHLECVAIEIRNLVRNGSEPACFLDIGSNDGSLMGSLKDHGWDAFGCDPSILPERQDLLSRTFSGFFSREGIERSFGPVRFDAVSSIAMFYDLPDPVQFAKDVSLLLTDGGFWYLEQTDLRTLLDTNAFDSICHEHTEYYSFRVLQKIIETAGMQIRRVWRTDSNGSSVACVATLAEHRLDLDDGSADAYATEEDGLISDVGACLRQVADSVTPLSRSIRTLVESERAQGRRIVGLGASTKGNTLLQTVGLTNADIEFILDRSPAKHGCFTPGSGIPIYDEAHWDLPSNSTAVVFPWHFRDSFLTRYKDFLERGGRLLFPLPTPSIVGVSRGGA